MFLKLLRYLFNASDREVRRCMGIAADIGSLEDEMRAKSDEELQQQTVLFRERLANGETLTDIMIPAFATVREAARRVIGLRPYDVQLVGGIILFEGKIAEMKTGEGKTLVATLPLYLHGLTGKGAHLITVNDYLATRDKTWMAPVLEFLGLSVGLILNDMEPAERVEQYGKDVTYGTNNEFGFDYLRDNMAVSSDEIVQRFHNFAIVDEVDSILVDEARTPLIISGPSDKPTSSYFQMARIVPTLVKDKDYEIDEKARTVTMTERGIANVEKALNIPNWFDQSNITNVHLLNQALKATHLFRRDVDYMVKDGEVIIVDEFTGRLMFGRSYSDGLHQAIEAKEGVEIRRENQTLATITLQNYFRMYETLAGMTGTAETEAGEFWEIYKLSVVVIPTNRPNSRIDQPDVIYKTELEKYRAVVREIIRANEKGQPVLVGTISIENSEILGKMLKQSGVNCNILNAKYHEKEADIIAQAGREGAITIATNMAGRGTDIVLGGNPEFLTELEFRKKGKMKEAVPDYEWADKFNEFKPLTDAEHERVLEAGGLYILGTERHESRRIDNQLRGRAGRQGDPGESRFFLSLEDDLMRKFGSDRIAGIMNTLGMEEDIPIESKTVSYALENAQKRVEGRNFEIRKQVLKYDDVMNSQRDAIYTQRQTFLREENLDDYVEDMIADVLDEILTIWEQSATYEEERDFGSLDKNIFGLFNIRLDQEKYGTLPREELFDEIKEICLDVLKQKSSEIGENQWRYLMKVVILRTLDEQWKEHLTNMRNLEEGIGLRAYGQKDPLVEYRFEGFEMFRNMLFTVKERVTEFLLKVEFNRESDESSKMELKKQEYNTNRDQSGAVVQMPKRRKTVKVGRNSPCACGSGKKSKQCCGR